MVLRRPVFLDRAAAYGLACLALVLLLTPTPRSAAAEPAWELTGLTGIVYRLDAPASGALFAWTEWTLHRSDERLHHPIPGLRTDIAGPGPRRGWLPVVDARRWAA